MSEHFVVHDCSQHESVEELLHSPSTLNLMPRYAKTLIHSLQSLSVHFFDLRYTDKLAVGTTPI